MDQRDALPTFLKTKKHRTIIKTFNKALAQLLEMSPECDQDLSNPNL